MSTTLEISRELAERVLPCLEGQLKKCEEIKASAEDEIAILKASLSELRARLDGMQLTTVSGGSRQRRPKGYGDDHIVGLLSSLPNGEGLSLSEIARRTGVDNSTVFRILNEPKRNKGRFTKSDDKWSIKNK